MNKRLQDALKRGVVGALIGLVAAVLMRALGMAETYNAYFWIPVAGAVAGVLRGFIHKGDAD